MTSVFRELFQSDTKFMRAVYGSELSSVLSETVPDSILVQLKGLWARHVETEEVNDALFYLTCGLITRCMDIAKSNNKEDRARSRTHLISQMRSIRRLMDKEFPTLTEEGKKTNVSTNYPIICPQCDRRFQSWKALANHVTVGHMYKHPAHHWGPKCWCGKKFNTPKGLAQHLNRTRDLRQHYKAATVEEALSNLEEL